MNEKRTFWMTQSSSLNRSDDQGFYRQKSAEHVGLLSEQEKSAGCIDLGCGAGEMLSCLAQHMNVEVGLDFSESMLEAAKDALRGYPEIKLVAADIFEYLPGCDHAVWMSTGGINQYLDEVESRRVLEIFSANTNAQSLFYFDCIDPIRYRLMQLGISYRPGDVEGARSTRMRKRVSRTVRRAQWAMKFAFGRFSSPFQYLGSPGMGYGALPHFWLDAAQRAGLTVEIVSSRYYEYRYHVIFRKA